MSTLLAAPLGLLLDRVFGEPRRFHPLVGFGMLAAMAEGALRREPDGDAVKRIKGVLAVVVLLTPIAAAAQVLASLPVAGGGIEVLLLYLALGARSLEEHGKAVAEALAGGDIAAARAKVGKIVSRDADGMDEGAVARATVESVLENGNDAVFAALFWFAIAGAPGVVLYRLSNTLDAMWGYRNARYVHFGWFAARLDDALNYVPARLTAIVYGVVGNFPRALACWRQQAPLWYSPNAGPVMAAGAGALGLKLGGDARYGGQWKRRPELGCGDAPRHADIGRALALVRRASYLWVALAVGIQWGLAHA